MGIIMEYQELFRRYKILLEKTDQLRQENRKLKARLGLQETPRLQGTTPPVKMGKVGPAGESKNVQPHAGITTASDSISKIRLFMSLFKGRGDVYAKRWENRHRGTSGYIPVCLNQWLPGVCGKPKIPCSRCENKSYAVLDESVIGDHLRGNSVVGIYPLLPDESCCFLAMDFDEGDWQKDVSAVGDVCKEFRIPLAVERSRSGDGCHVWFFFEIPISAVLARKFGTALLTCTMERRHEINFRSYDRLFPSQDTMPKGGLGNLIALPLQKAAREKSNSEFVDGHFRSYSDQWKFLFSIQRIPENRLETLVAGLSHGNELGNLKIDEAEEKPWEARPSKKMLEKDDFPDHLEIVRANMLYVPKTGITQRALNQLKRLASFKNPMFYRQQAIRLSTYGHPRVISCTDETKKYLCLPRGCEPDLLDVLKAPGVDVEVADNTFHGNRIDVEFKGQLRGDQALALGHLRQHHTGILSGTTAFGKTIVAIKLIAEKKINTLILVDKISLLSQWKEKLSEFLIINQTLPAEPVSTVPKRGRKKKKSIIGQIGGGRNTLTGIIDIAVMQSLSRQGEVKQCVKDYGLIIVDECHHASAFTYEQILRNTSAKYIYGLTATPTRKDGHHPILFMHCGPIRYRDSPKKQAQNRPFDHTVIPRFTSLRMPMGTDSKNLSIQELYSQIMDNDFRNQLIAEDILKNYRQGRNCLVLTLRTAHVERLVKRIKKDIPAVIALTGGLGKKLTREAFRRIAAIPPEKNIVLVATGHFIGEGFDEPRLDTLFLAMPISWKGTLQQYAGRLHRLFKTKKEVRIYDYVDIQIKMLENMYQRRLNSYALMGYKARAEEVMDAPPDMIFNQDNFRPVFDQDIIAAKKEILIVSPFARQRRTHQMVQLLKPVICKNNHITMVTRPKENFPAKDQPAIQKALDLITRNGINIIFKSNIHQKFAIMDQKIVWYGSINLLSYGRAQESIMRIEGSNIANQLIKSVEAE